VSDPEAYQTSLQCNATCIDGDVVRRRATVVEETEVDATSIDGDVVRRRATGVEEAEVDATSIDGDVVRRREKSIDATRIDGHALDQYDHAITGKGQVPSVGKKKTKQEVLVSTRHEVSLKGKERFLNDEWEGVRGEGHVWRSGQSRRSGVKEGVVVASEKITAEWMFDR
jgi:hypothetical protein